MVSFLCFSGSIRRDSCNVLLAKAAKNQLISMGAEADYIDLAEYPMPIYNGDLEAEQGLPDAVVELKQRLRKVNGFFIASPEYNGSFSALLKNTIDWISRPEHSNEPMLEAFTSKIVGIGAASPGGLGGIRGLVPLRMLLGNVGAYVVPNQVSIPGAYDAFDADGVIKNETHQTLLNQLARQMVDLGRALD